MLRQTITLRDRFAFVHVLRHTAKEAEELSLNGAGGGRVRRLGGRRSPGPGGDRDR